MVSKEILKRKYFKENEDFEGFVNRVCSIFSRNQNEIKQALIDGDFFPAGRILNSAGLEKDNISATPMNCYVLPSPEDNIESIYKTQAEMAKTFSRGGGCGINISNLRPKDAKVNNTAKTTTGAVSFLELFNTTGSIIGQNGRRSAIMIGLNCSHPDIEEFLHIKETNHKLEHMNISILFTDEFMQAVRDGKDYTCSFFVPETGEKIEKTINAKEFFKRFCKVNWNYGDPGVMFIDTIRNKNLLSGYDDYKIEISNPCSEFLGSAYTACCLGSINLYNCVDNKFSPNAEFNFEKFNNLVSIGVDALNQVLDYGRDKQPLEANKKAIDDWRNIGLGFFGLADALVALGIRYGSKEAQALLYSISKIMMLKALDSSWNLAALQGTFKKYNWEKTKKSKIISNLKGTLLGNSLYEGIKEDGLANGSLISIAPTGTISLLAGGFSGGIEPMFKVSYERTTHTLEGKGETFRVFPTSIKELLEYHNLPLTLTNEEIKEKFSHIVEADEIPYVERIGMQASTQRPIDNAISSTINLPESATPEDIFNIYMMAWEAGLKGTTVFRDGCMRLSILNPKKKSEDFDNNFGEIVPMKREETGSLPSLTYKKQSACSKLYPTITFKDGKPFEVFASVTGGCSANIATIVRLSSLALRCGVKPEKLIEELKEQKCPACKTLRGQGRKNISLSCGNAIAESLQEAIAEFNGDFKEKTNIKQPKQTVEVHKERVRKKCPECGAEIRAEGNCISCTQCSWSKCE
jgi:ribonucleoside-diphosphate reductase alpha chain